MADKKAGRGGPRPAVRPDDARGGAARGQGRLITSGIAPFDRETARSIKTLILARGWPYTRENVTKLLSEWAEEQWRAYEAERLRDAEAWDGGVL